MPGVYDERNKLNDLTGKEWLKLTKSFWKSESSKADRDAFEHPAPFMVKDIEKLISFFTKSGMTVLDPFMGAGTTGIAASNLNRKSIGIDLNPDYQKLAYRRYEKNKVDLSEHKYIVGDSLHELDTLEMVDYIVTSPPYHNILRNKNTGIRSDNSHKGFRNGARQGIKYYSEKPNDLGNQDDYNDFLILLENIMKKCYFILQNEKYCTIIMSDFTVNRKEICVQADIVNLMENIGFEFVGTTVLLQDNKPLFPFAYPYSYRINHMHQNMMSFRKVE